MLGKEQISMANIEVFLKSINLAFKISAITCIVGIYFSYVRGEILTDKTSNDSS